MEAEALGLELSALAGEKGPEPGPGAEQPNGLGGKAGGGDDGDDGDGDGERAPPGAGLRKEQLLEAAGAAPWARARLALLVLFWAAWAGMVGAAAAIVARAPRCPAPGPGPAPRAWWHPGGLYRVPREDLAGERFWGGAAAERQLEAVAALGVGGLVLGPLHPQSAAPGELPPLDRIDPALGDLGRFQELLRLARARGLQVLLDVTPNPGGEGPAWLGPRVTGDPDFPGNVTRALRLWLERGVAGFFLDGVDELEPEVVAAWRNETERETGPDGAERVLLGSSRARAGRALLELLNGSRAGPEGAGPEGAGPEGAGLVLGPFLEELWPRPPGPGPDPRLLELLPHIGPRVVWSVGSPQRNLWGVSGPRAPQRLLLLWALPGVPLLHYGDEMGLARPHGGPGDAQVPRESPEEPHSAQGGGPSPRELCRRLGALRRRERALALGEASRVRAAAAGEATAFLRRREGSDTFLVLVNNGNATLAPGLSDPRVPARAALRLSTHRALPPEPGLELAALRLLPYEGLLLSFP